MSNQFTNEQFGLGALPNPTRLSFASLGNRSSLGFATTPQTPSVDGIGSESGHPYSEEKTPPIIEFRISREGQPSRRLRLSGERYTFGSGDGCSIRLADPALRPMHAVLIRDAYRILVRAYSIPIVVNGVRTTEAILSVGDLLQLGSYRLELLGHPNDSSRPDQLPSPTSAVPEWPGTRGLASAKLKFADAPSPTISTSSNVGPERRQPGTSEDRHTSGRHEMLASEQSVWREQLRREVEQWRAAKAECDRRETRCDDRETELRERENELWTRAEQIRAREAKLKSQESAVIEIQAEYDAKQQSLIEMRDQNRTRQIAFERREAEFRRSEKDFQEQLEQATKQLERSQHQAAAANEAVQRMRDQFAALNDQLEQLTEQQVQLQQQGETQAVQHRAAIGHLEQLREEAIVERDEALRSRANFVLERDEAFRRRDEAEVLHAAAVKRAEELVERLESLESTHQLSLAERDAIAAEREQLILELDETNRERNDAITRAERAVEQLNSVIAQRDQFAAKHKQLIEERDQAIAKRDEATKLRDAAISKIDEAIAQHDEAILQRDTAYRQRDEIIESQSQSEADRFELEQRLATLATQLEQAEAQLRESQKASADRSLLTTELQSQVERLQASVVTAKNETERLRADYEEACRSVAQLDAMVREQSLHSDEARKSWAAESDHLRESVEGISRDLAIALGELEQLRDQNERLTQQLADARNQNSQLSETLASLPTASEWVEIQSQLNLATTSLTAVQNDYDRTLAELEKTRGELELERRLRSDQERDHKAAKDEHETAFRKAQADMHTGQGRQSQFDQPSSARVASFSSSETPTASGPSAHKISEPTSSDDGDSCEQTFIAASAEWAAEDAWPTYNSLPKAPPALGPSPIETPTSASSFNTPSEDYDRFRDQRSSVVPPSTTESTWNVPTAEGMGFASPAKPSNESNKDHSVGQEPPGTKSVWKTDESDVEPELQYEPIGWPSDNAGNATNGVTGKTYSTDDDSSLARFRNAGERENDSAVAPGASTWNSTWTHQDHDTSSDDAISPRSGDEVDSGVSTSGDSWAGSLAQQLINDFKSEHRADAPNEDEDNADEYNVTAIHGPGTPFIPQDGRATWEHTQEHDSSAMPWRVEPENEDAEWQPTYVGDVNPSPYGVQSTEQVVLENRYGLTGTPEAVDPQSINSLNDSNAYKWDRVTDSQVMNSEVVLGDEPRPLSSRETVITHLDADDANSNTSDANKPTSQSSPDAEADDDSIEAYMNRLLQRVQGVTSSPSSTPSASTTTTSRYHESTNSTFTDTSLSTTKPTPFAPVEEFDRTAPLVPRSSAPENPNNLHAMRQLANDSARIAISRSVKTQTRDTQIKAITKFISAAGITACAIAAFFLVHFAGTPILIGAMLVIAFVWVREGMTLMGDARRRLELAAEGVANQESPGPQPTTVEAPSTGFNALREPRV